MNNARTQLRSLVPMMLAACFAWSCATGPKSAGVSEGQAVALEPSSRKAPAVKAEFRGVWVASVANINWPSKPGLSTAQQQAELRLLLDRAVELNLNAVLLQVRPACDALYASDLEPWSYFLTGQEGKAPEPYYDPLTFAVDEAHQRGLELHAWLNPFRARQTGYTFKSAPDSVQAKHPQWVIKYGPTLQWLDPGHPGAREHSLAVINDLVKRYDLDGVHVDDYFYPYRITDKAKKEIDFPDDDSFARYGGGMTRSDWRRANINDFIRKMYEQTKATKPHVKVGISPFGIWRPGNPAQIKGFDAYEKLAGDTKLWMHEGWADYFSPQLYWPIDQTPQSYPVLLNYWVEQNAKGRHLWPGLFSSKTDGKRPDWKPEEVEYQIKIARGFAGSTGVVHFSATILNPPKSSTQPVHPLFKRLSETVYTEPTVIPPSPWLVSPGEARPVAPVNAVATRATRDGLPGLLVKWDAPAGSAGLSAPFNYVVQWTKQPVIETTEGTGQTTVAAAPTGKWAQAMVPAAGLREFFIPGTLPDTIVLTTADRTGRLSEGVTLKVARDAKAAPAVAAGN